jgi:hypothetical protein
LRSTRIDSYNDATLENKGERGSSVQHLDGLGLAILESIVQERAGIASWQRESVNVEHLSLEHIFLLVASQIEEVQVELGRHNFLL